LLLFNVLGVSLEVLGPVEVLGSSPEVLGPSQEVLALRAFGAAAAPESE
jgi:hypothetical protein